MEQPAKLTLEDLAVMVQQGFSDMSSRFDNRVDRLEQELKDFHEITENRFDAIEQRLERIEYRMPEFAHRFEVTELYRRVTALERKNI